MGISVFDLFKIGIGPSSSHTVGPMLAGRRFLSEIRAENRLNNVTGIDVTLYGSLAHTGRGHGTDKAILCGLSGEMPALVEPEKVPALVEQISQSKTLCLLGEQPIDFDPQRDLLFNLSDQLPRHPNGMRFRAKGKDSQVWRERDYYSIGGGFILGADEPVESEATVAIPYPFTSASQLLEHCRRLGVRVPDLAKANEAAFRPWLETEKGLRQIWDVMQACVQHGISHEGLLPGGLKVRRRAPGLYKSLTEVHPDNPLDVMDWVNVFALAVNEENAVGGRVVTAPTNGAAGIIPAVLHYYWKFVDGATEEGVMEFLLTAGAIGMLYKENASISGAEMGCQGEVGVACSMAASGLAAALGASNEQIENAGEIGMEHNLGLTCDPIKGLVQIPCIERNAMAAVKAINAQRLAMHGNGQHRVSLDEVISTMRETGRNMQTIYKETSLGGLAVNVIEC